MTESTMSSTDLAIPVTPESVTATPPVPTTLYSWRDLHPNAQLHYIRHHDEADDALDRLHNGVYGFDLEWKPTFVRGQSENPVSLVQIANHEIILLIQVTAMQRFPSSLRRFLASPNFCKAGAGIQGDTKKLHRDWGVDVHNCVDLSLLARTVDNGTWKGRYTDPLGLARMIAVYENRKLLKGKITRSNWEARLNDEQQLYAANDAHAGYVIYMRLMSMMRSLVPQPRARYYAFGSVSGRLCDSSGSTWQPSNPNYDPGPPPPPRKSKEQREPESQQQLPKNTSIDHHHSTTSTLDQNSDASCALAPSQPSSSFLRGATQQRNIKGPVGNNNPVNHIRSRLPQMSAQGSPRRPRHPRKRPKRTLEESKPSSNL